MGRKQRKSDGNKALQRQPGAPQAALASAEAKAGAGGEKSPVLARLLWLSALVLIVCGYLFLNKADPGGKNGWAVAAPASLLAGYLLIIPAILVSYREKN
ncbi:MAG: hypothetical protein NDI60_07960 [Elusimicrobiales bacterium]|nr:hypothetical protein [Elusimicrobiales bacterium]